MAISEYADQPRYAGSLDNGAVDAEYTVQPERIICAAEQHWATRADLRALERRVAHLERIVHRMLNDDADDA